MNRSRGLTLLFLCILTVSLAGCGKEKKKRHHLRTTPVTSVKVLAKPMQVMEHSIGEIESLSSPLVAAEVSGLVKHIFVDAGQSVKKGDLLAEIDPEDQRLLRQQSLADTKRLQALYQNQLKIVKRQRELLKEKFISQNVLDDAESKLASLKQELQGGKARLSSTERKLTKTKVSAPVDGEIEKRFVNVGDYMNIGSPMFKIATDKELRIHLPFPERIAGKLHTGLKVFLTSPTDPERKVTGTVTKIKPMVNLSNRSLDVIVHLSNPGNWFPGSSISGELLLEEHPHALVVPELSVVRRPAGTVVYVLQEEQKKKPSAGTESSAKSPPPLIKARQRLVKTGIRKDGLVEITEGLQEGEVIAYDGAGFLTDNTPVSVKGEL